MRTASRRVLIMHFTDVENLAGIVARGEVLSDTLIGRSGGPARDCADASIKNRRRNITIRVSPYGTVGDYVPFYFYFAPRSPMMYRINCGGVQGYERGQDCLVYLVSSVETVLANELVWVGSDGNCAATMTKHYNAWPDLRAVVDWPLMAAKYWSYTEDDGDRVRRRQAEFLVHRTFPIGCINGIVAKSAGAANQARQAVGDSISVKVYPSWYF